MAVDDERAGSPESWQGVNLLGFALMECATASARGRPCEHMARCLASRAVPNPLVCCAERRFAVTAAATESTPSACTPRC